MINEFNCRSEQLVLSLYGRGSLNTLLLFEQLATSLHDLSTATQMVILGSHRLQL